MGQEHLKTSCFPELHLADFTSSELRSTTKVSASSLTTFGLGGLLPLVLEPQNPEALCEVLARCTSAALPWRILGAGSNLLISSKGIEGPCIKLGKKLSGWMLLEGAETSASSIPLLSLPRKGIEGINRPLLSESVVEIFALGATPMMSLSRQVSALGLSGLEFSAGIPGSVGGAVKMNAGAHGSQISSILTSVMLVDAHGTVTEKTLEELGFSYRHSNIAATELVLAAKLALRVGEPSTIQQNRASALEYRRQTQPLHLPSAGSVFKNPMVDLQATNLTQQPPPAAAALLEQLGYKGKTRRGISFSQMHANWLVRLDNSGEAEDAAFLIAQAQQEVKERFGIELETEIIHW